MALAGAKTVGSLVAPGEAEAYHFCGHIYTTDSCPHPTGPAADRRASGFPLRAQRRTPVDDLGRYIDAAGAPVDEDGSRSSTPTAAAARAPRARRSATPSPTSTASSPHIDGAWYRCCGGHVRKLVDCCGYIRTPHQRRQAR